MKRINFTNNQRNTSKINGIIFTYRLTENLKDK